MYGLVTNGPWPNTVAGDCWSIEKFAKFKDAVKSDVRDENFWLNLWQKIFQWQ